MNGQISRADLAKITNIRPPTVTAIIRELLAEGLVVELGAGQTRGGRAPRILALSCEQPRAIGFEISNSAILAGLSDLRGNLCVRKRIRYSPVDPVRMLDQLEQLASEMFAEVAAPGEPFGWTKMDGAGIALPGLIDTAGGVVTFSQPLGWKDVALRDLCETRWGVRTDVVNDSAAGSMAAHFLSAGAARNLVYVVLRFAASDHGVVGVGCGLIVQGEPYHGEFGAAGEITTPIAHPLVYARNGDGAAFPSTSAFVAALRDGAPGAASAMDRVARELSLLVLHAINLLDPGQLILEADEPELGEALRVRLDRALEEHALRAGRGRTQIVSSTLDEFGGVRGAVVPALRRFFRLPNWA